MLHSHHLFYSLELDAARIFVIEVLFKVIRERQVHSERNEIFIGPIHLLALWVMREG